MKQFEHSDFQQLEREHQKLKKDFAELQKKHINVMKSQAIHSAMKGRNYHSRDQVVKLSWDDLQYDISTEKLHAPGYSSPAEYFRVRAKEKPYEVKADGPTVVPRPRRSEMTWKERADFVDKYGSDEYLSLEE